MNKKETAQKTDRPITAEVAKFMHFHRDGDIIPHGWNKKIGRWHDSTNTTTGKTVKIWRSRPFAERLLARIVWFYTPSPVKNDSGEVTGWKRKFRAEYWQMNAEEMAQAMGCSRRTIVDELSLLRELGLVTSRDSRGKTPSDGNRNVPLFVIPVFDAIVGLTRAGEVSSLGASEVSSQFLIPIPHSYSSLVANATSDPKPNTQNTEINMDFIDMAFDRAEKMAANRDAVALTVIGLWNLAPHLSDICAEFVGISHVPVSKGDKGKWAKGASLIHEIAACRTMKAAYTKGRADGLTLTWPGALVELCKEVLATSTTAEIRAAQPATIWFNAPGGGVVKIDACKREAALAAGYKAVNNDD